MVVPHYTYLKMKMPSPHGVITIFGDYKRSITYTMDSAKVAETMMCNEEMRQFKRKISEEQPEVPESAKPAGESSF